MGTTQRTYIPSRTQPPHVSASAIERVGLHDRLDGVLDHPLTLVTAPAGFGKSWAVAGWLQGAARPPSCWVTVDSYDDDAMRLWTHVIGAVLGSSRSAAATEAEGLIAGSPAAWPRIVDTLAAGLAEGAEPLVIVLDDIHTVTNPEALASLQQFLAQLPTTSHVVLVGRHDPDIPLARWRVTGTLLEIRSTDLRCDREETAALVRDSLGLRLTDEDVSTIHERTMGWLAGIRLVAATIARRPGNAATLDDVSSVHGAYDALGDYLVEEILGTLDEDTRRFLLDTSVLTTLDTALCDHVAETDASATILRDFERSGFFVTRLADDVYRLHDLVRDALRAILHRQTPGRETELRLRAAHWFHDHGDPIDAVGYALEVERPDLAERWLIETARELLVAKQISTACALFDRLDATGHEMSASGLLVWSMVIIHSTRPASEIDRSLRRTLDRLEAMDDDEARQLSVDLRGAPYRYGESPLEAKLTVQASMAHRYGDTESAVATLEAMGSTASDNGVIEALAGEALIYQEQYEPGMALLRRWTDWATTASGVLASNLAFGLTFHAYGLVGQGKLDEAERMAERAVEALQAIGLSELPVYAIGALPAGWVAWERGDVAAAEAMVEVVAPVIDLYGEIPATVLARMLQARVRFSKGDPEAAFAALHEARVTRSAHPVDGHFAERITFEQLRLHLLLGDPAAASLELPDWRERIERGPDGMREQLLLARLSIESGEDATALLEELPAGAEVTVVHQMELGKLRALVALRDGDEAGALEHLTAAMRIAVHTGHRQLFLDDEGALGALLDNAAAASGFLLRFDRDAPPVAPVADAQARLIEPLSERELELLRLLPSHLSYREIGERMFLSTNTVKSYVKSVYRKLDADRRTEAVERARAIGLVP